MFDQIRHNSFTAPFGTMRTIFILISNPLFRLSRPSRFVLPFWFSHCFLLNRHKNPIYTRLFLQRRVVFLCILDFKTVETIKKVRNFNFFCRTDTKLHKSYSFLTQKNTNFLVEMCVFLRYNSTITKKHRGGHDNVRIQGYHRGRERSVPSHNRRILPNGQRNYPR